MCDVQNSLPLARLKEQSFGECEGKLWLGVFNLIYIIWRNKIIDFSMSHWCCVLFIGFLCIRIRYRIHYSIFLELAAKMRWNIVPGMILFIKSEYKSYMRSTNCMKTENKRIEMAVERLWGSSSHFSLRVLLFHSTMETAEYCWYHSDLGYSWVPACITAIWKYIFLSCEEAADGKVCLFHM